MEIPPGGRPPPVPQPLLNLAPLNRESQQRLNVGQQLTALVSSNSSEGRVTLNINGRQLEATTALQLTAGLQLKVKVEKGQEGHLLLRLLEPPRPPQLQQALRRELPKQGDLKPLFEALLPVAEPTGKASVAPPPAATTPLPERLSAQAPSERLTAAPGPALRRAARQLLEALPTPAKVADSRSLRQVVENSGLFLEQRLAHGGKGVEQDIKGLLLRLLVLLPRGDQPAPTSAPAATTKPPPTAEGTVIRPTTPPSLIPPSTSNPAPSRPVAQTGTAPPQASTEEPALFALLQGLLKKGESALARLQINQFHALPKSETENPQWLLELPVRQPNQELETLKLRIERDDKRNGPDGAPHWSVKLELEDGEGAPIRAHLGLSRERIGVNFWAESAETAERLGEKLSELEKRLRQRGLEVNRLESRCGQPSDEPPPRTDGLLRETV